MIEFPPFELDTINQCLWRRAGGANERILLPPRTFALLCYLVEHPGRLVTEDELLNAVWPKAYVQPEAIKSQLYEIRKILGDDPKAPRYIETLPRRGYRFIAPVRAGPFEDPLAAAKPVHGRLVGRDGTIAELWNRLRAASRSRRQIVFVTGEPGIGKTAVVDELQRQASIEMPGLHVARSQCIDAYGATEPYYPMLEALGQLCAGSKAASIVDILAAQAPTWLVQFPALLTQRHRELLRQEILGATRERMVRELGAALETITADTPLLLVIEDLQWVDHSTVNLIAALARRPAPTKLMLLATMRPVDSNSAGQALKAVKDELRSHQQCHEIELQPLAEAEVTEYLAPEASQGKAPVGLAELVHRHTEGNPLFMVAALDHLIQRGLISREDGSWYLSVPLEAIDIGVPENLRQLIEAQIDRLSVEEQRALEVASVQGAAFSTSICAALINRDTEPYENLYESIAQRRYIMRSVDILQLADGSISSQYEFVHSLYREVLYRRQAPLRRAKLHQRIGERLEALYSQQLSDVAPQLAYHFEQGADWQRAARYLQLASGAARRRYARREAVAMLQQALDLSSKLPAASSATMESALLEDLATMTAASFDTMDRAVESYEKIAARARQHGLIGAELNVLISMCYSLHWIDSKRCAAVAERALQLSAELSDPVLRARGRACGLYFRMWTAGWDDGAFQEFERALAELRRATASDRGIFALDLIGYSFLQHATSRYRDALRSTREGVSIVRETGDQNPFFSLAYQRAASFLPWIHMFLGEWGNALLEVRTEIAVMNKNEDSLRAESLQLHDAWVRLHAMDFAAVSESCRRSLGLFQDPFRSVYARFVLILAGQAETGARNFELAQKYLLAARDAIRNGIGINAWYLHNQLEHAITDLWLAQGDLVQARPQAERFLGVAQAVPEHTYLARAWEANARVAMAEGDLRRANECIAEALSSMEGFEVPLAAWEVHATAADLCHRAGNERSAQQHRELSRNTILMLANSLPAEEEALRRTFLSAAPIANILGASVRTWRLQ